MSPHHVSLQLHKRHYMHVNRKILFLQLLNKKENKTELPFCADFPYRFCVESQGSVSLWPFWTAHVRKSENTHTGTTGLLVRRPYLQAGVSVTPLPPPQGQRLQVFCRIVVQLWRQEPGQRVAPCKRKNRPTSLKTRRPSKILK